MRVVSPTIRRKQDMERLTVDGSERIQHQRRRRSQDHQRYYSIYFANYRSYVILVIVDPWGSLGAEGVRS